MERGNTKQEKQQEDKGHDSCTMHKRKKALNEKCESSLEAEGRKFGQKKKKKEKPKHDEIYENPRIYYPRKIIKDKSFKNFKTHLKLK